MLIIVLYRRGAPGGKLKMTLGLPVYVLFPITSSSALSSNRHIHNYNIYGISISFNTTYHSNSFQYSIEPPVQ